MAHEEFFEELQWLKRPPPPKFFPSKGGKKPGAAEYTKHKEKETWAYTATMELLKGPKGGGRVVLRSYTGGVVGRANFSDMNEGTRLFEDLWEEAQLQTQALESKANG